MTPQTAEYGENPAARADFRQHQIGRHLEDQIADKEDAAAEAEHLCREAEILVHGQGGEADIHAVDVIDHVQHHRERDQAPRAFGENPLFVHRPMLPVPALLRRLRRLGYHSLATLR